MEGRLIILFACVTLTLIVNTVILFLVFRIFGNLANKFTEGLHEFQTSGPTRQSLNLLRSAAEEAARATGTLRDQVVAFGPSLERIQAEHTERLAKADVRFKLAFRALHFTSATIEKIAIWPIRNIRTASSVIKGIFAFIRGTQTDSDSDARPRRSR